MGQVLYDMQHTHNYFLSIDDFNYSFANIYICNILFHNFIKELDLFNVYSLILFKNEHQNLHSKNLLNQLFHDLVN